MERKHTNTERKKNDRMEVIKENKKKLKRGKKQ
jgi:hypothetical protein